MRTINVSHLFCQPTAAPFKLIWGMPSRRELQALADYNGFIVVVFTGGHQHAVKTNNLFKRLLNSLQPKKGSKHCRRSLGHHIVAYSVPCLTDRAAANTYFTKIFDTLWDNQWCPPASTRRGTLNLSDPLL